MEKILKELAKKYKTNEFDVLFTFCGWVQDLARLYIGNKNLFKIMEDDFGTPLNALKEFAKNEKTLKKRFQQGIKKQVFQHVIS